jgi:pilus assembly protein CpaE
VTSVPTDDVGSSAVGGATPPVVVVVSPKGGSGKTTVVSNLAVAMAAVAGGVVVVDLDVHFGDVEVALGLDPLYRLDDAVIRSAGTGDMDHLLTPHRSGVVALCAPADPVAADHLPPEGVMAVLDRLVALGRPVVVDTSAGITEFTLGALDRATEVVVVSSTDVPSVRGARKLLDTMGPLGLDPSAVHLVINRSSARNGLTAADAEATIGLAAEVQVPEDRALAAGMNAGVPLVDSQPRTATSVVFARLAANVLAAGTPTSTRRTHRSRNAPRSVRRAARSATRSADRGIVPSNRSRT